MGRLFNIFPPLLMTALLLPAIGVANELRVGRSSVDITPEIGTPMLTPQRPPFEVKLATEAHDPLQVKAIVLQSGPDTAAIVSCDLTSIPLRIIQEARRLIGESTPLAPSTVLICATHCHTVPQIRARFLGNVEAESRDKGMQYIDALPAKIAEAVQLAQADLRKANVAAAVVLEDSVSFNRRYYLRDGTVLTNPFKNEDEKLNQVLRPTGPIDPELSVVAFANEANQPLAILANFSLHLDTVGGDRPSADFPFMIQQLVHSVHGPDAMLFWASGASGNVNHYDLTDPVRFRREKGIHEASRIGAILGGDVLRLYPRLNELRSAPLRAAREIVLLDYRPEKCPDVLNRMGNATRYFDGEVDVVNIDGKLKFEAEVQAIALGDELAWVGLPGEMFTEFGIALKKASPFRYTIVHSLANGAIGYVPNRRAYPEGSYEADASRCAPGGGEQLVEVATDLLVRLKDTKRHVEVAGAKLRYEVQLLNVCCLRTNRLLLLVATVLFSAASFCFAVDAAHEIDWRPLAAADVGGKGWSDTERPFDRLPATAKAVVRPAVWELARHSAGVYVDFVTNASTIWGRWTLSSERLAMSHMPATGVSGVDLYVFQDDRWHFMGNGRPSMFPTNEVALAENLQPTEATYRIYFPLYNGTSSLEIGLPKGSTFRIVPPNRGNSKPVVVYGTSITQGGCASRPGMSYPAILGRRLNVPFINLGFSGNGKSEPEVARLLSELDAGTFIIDPLPNLLAADVSERLPEFLEIIRSRHPDTPILLVESPLFPNMPFSPARAQRVNESNKNLRDICESRKAKGDQNIMLVSACDFTVRGGEATVDGIHPTDVGFLELADTIEPTLRAVLSAKQP